MRTKFKFLTYFFSFTVALFMFNLRVYSDEYTLSAISLAESTSASGVVGTGCPTTEGWIGCFPGPKGVAGKPVAIRVTLVDGNGKKIEGTRSVDFAYSSKYQTVKTKYDDSLRMEEYSYTATIVGKKVFKYKFSDKYSDYNEGELLYIEFPGGPNFIKDGNFAVQNFTEKIVNYDKYLYRYSAMKNVHIIEYVTRYLGYFASTEPFIGDKVAALNDYYLLMEPTYFIKYNSIKNHGIDTYRYGTATELASYIYGPKAHMGAQMGLASRVYKFACHYAYNDTVYDEVNGKVMFELGTSYCPNKTPKEEFSTAVTRGKKILNSDYGLGVGVVDLNVKGVGITTWDGNFDLDLCKSGIRTEGETDVEYKADGILSFSTHNSELISGDYLYNDYDTNGTGSLFYETGTPENNNLVMCYDNVFYDFTEALTKLNRAHNLVSLITVPSGTGHFERICRVGAEASYKIEDNIRDYKNREYYEVKWYTSNYNFDANLIPRTGTTDQYFDIEEIQTYGDGSKLVKYTFDIEYSMLTPLAYGSKIEKIDKKNENNGFSIRLKQKAFGKVGKSVGTWYQKNKDGFYSDDYAGLRDKYSITLNYLDGDVFNDDVYWGDNTGISDRKCIVFPSYETNVDVKFRTISLENPFPARDGTSRLPGINWLNNENKVFQYIMNNRGIRYVTENKEVSPEEIYSKVEPMYTVTLDSGTMRKIRTYNSDNSGYIMPSVECDSDGRQCYSGFLRDSEYFSSSNVTGACYLSKDSITSTLKSSYTDSELSSILDAVSEGEYNKLYDLNRDFSVNFEDYDVAAHADLNTNFYTCANKTYKSGGPVTYNEGGSE